MGLTADPFQQVTFTGLHSTVTVGSGPDCRPISAGDITGLHSTVTVGSGPDCRPISAGDIYWAP